jgi:outer membrane immunogenic protein
MSMSMSLLRNLFISGALLAPISAFSADVVDAVPSAPESPFESSISNWTGGYAGVSGGYAKGEASLQGKVTTKGMQGSLFAGYNVQSDTILYGLDTDIGYSADKGKSGETFKKGLNGTARARIGADFGSVMPYGALGVTTAKAKVSSATDDDSNLHYGWTAGMGADAKIADNVFGRLEFRHNNYGSKKYEVDGITNNVKFKENEIRVGIGMKF